MLTGSRTRRPAALTHGGGGGARRCLQALDGRGWKAKVVCLSEVEVTSNSVTSRLWSCGSGGGGGGESERSLVLFIVSTGSGRRY